MHGIMQVKIKLLKKTFFDCGLGWETTMSNAWDFPQLSEQNQSCQRATKSLQIADTTVDRQKTDCAKQKKFSIFLCCNFLHSKSNRQHQMHFPLIFIMLINIVAHI